MNATILRAVLPAAFALLLADRPPLAPNPLAPDEGQWLPQQIRAMNWAALEARGMQLTRDEFWHPERGGVLSAAVQIGGCTASFVSADGLVVTNHHCGFGAVNALSSTEHNYLRDGFVAATPAAELPAPGMVVLVVRRIEDVTAKVHAAQAEATSDLDRWQRTQEVIRQLVAEGEKEPDTTCSVASFYEGREYHLYYRTRLTDVRLVYAPPRAIGEYGGEVDNWEWPRHTGDFTFFRAYAAPDGSPRAHSSDNVPFRPEHWLKVSADGVQDDDLVLILGYPGTTERYLTSVAVADREGVFYPLRLDLLTRVLAVLERQANRSEQDQLDYASLIKSLANVQKNAAGMVWGLARNAVVARKQREEAEFRQWLAASPDRMARYGSVLDELLAADREASRTTRKDLVLGLALSSRINPFLRGICDLVAATADNRDGRGSGNLRRRFGSDALTRDLQAVQQPLLAILLDEVRRLDGDDAFAGRTALRPETDEPTAQVVAELLQSPLTTAAGRISLLESGPDGLAASADPLVKLALGLNAERDAMVDRSRNAEGRSVVLARAWIEAQQEWRGTSFYPDANSTLRVSIASVKGYEPRDGVRYTPHTTVAGLLAKHTGTEPFDAPAALRTAAESRRASRYFDPRVGDVPVCFLTDGDTTGGNSGSPVVNGKGELVGLNFDRVFENVSGDYGWSPDRSRNVSVDVRFVLWCLESVLPAHHLLREMGVWRDAPVPGAKRAPAGAR
ncbi:MAG: S46 family peptidase [Planctomycetes bacterium]|nr:S46 family peptidase [Planctomycetota bacterium]